MIELQNVVKAFRRNRVLDGISLNIDEGERIALIGQNGSGKTTLIRCLLGLYAVDAGDVAVLGRDPRVARESVLGEVGFVPQLAPGIRSTVGEFLRATTQICDVTGSSIVEVAQRLGLDLTKISGRAFFALSGGMKQKLLIAIALARRPRLLIMDEPAANLDPTARARFFSELEQLDAATTVILSSHRIDEISQLVTRLVELDSGKIVLDDLVSVHSVHRSDYLSCTLALHQANVHVASILSEWQLTSDNEEQTRWVGRIAAADRFRFVCLLARWSGLLQDIRLSEENYEAR